MTTPSIAQAAFDALPVQTAVVDSAGVIVRTNAAWRAFDDWDGVDPVADPTGRNYLRVCRQTGERGDADGDRSPAVDGGVRAGATGADVDGAMVADGIEAVLVGDRETFDHEYACHSPDERRWFLMRASAVDHEGETYAQVFHLDITERKLAEATLESRNDRLETLAGVLAHDLRNPLQVVQGRSELLDARLDDAEGDAERTDETAADLESIRSSADRIGAIIGDALQLARGGFSSGDPPTELRLRAAAETAWEHVRADEATLRVTDSFAFEGRAGPVGQILENLLANAVDHGGPDVTVVVGVLVADATEPSGFYVADDGPGIDPEQRSAVFDPGHTTGDDGTGLGLAIVEQFVEAQGWYVEVVAGSDGGARFEIRGVGPV
ncbi:PAS domain-containing sensor histidine kinase [Halobaculum marinum]|uniref:histidine kinase n=1 Tax=Halobaculum marinum TaxID=3031996 RepID=A0ABD5WZW9_9EURY|nr:HAMP domain-containing sensor histidine kinase [Halobaculum sp. DT55]